MSQHDYDIANQAFAATRADINAALQALATNSSGATAPATTFAFMWWADTTAGILKQRNAANSAWVSVLNLATGAPVVAPTVADGSITAPKLSGAQTGAAPIYGARAWCFFNGATAGTNAPTAGGNVSTVQRNGLGDYTVTFVTAMPDALYGITGGASASSTSDTRGGVVTVVQSSKSTSSFRFVVTRVGDNGAGPTLIDCAEVSLAIFR